MSIVLRSQETSPVSPIEYAFIDALLDRLWSSNYNKVPETLRIPCDDSCAWCGADWKHGTYEGYHDLDPKTGQVIFIPIMHYEYCDTNFIAWVQKVLHYFGLTPSF